MLVVDAAGGVAATVEMVRLRDAKAVSVPLPVPGGGASFDGAISAR